MRGILKVYKWASLVVQWLRIHPAMQGTQVQSLVQEDLTCCRATKSVTTSELKLLSPCAMTTEARVP